MLSNCFALLTAIFSGLFNLVLVTASISAHADAGNELYSIVASNKVNNSYNLNVLMLSDSYSRGLFLLPGVADLNNDSLPLSVNKFPRERAVNLYFLNRSVVGKVAPSAVENCRSFTENGQRFVVCDADWVSCLNALVKKQESGPTTAYPLLAWIVGHELGHHHLDHPTLKKGTRHSRHDIRKMEREADAFASRAYSDPALLESLYNHFFEDQDRRWQGEGSNSSVDWIESWIATHDRPNIRMRRFARTVVQIYTNGERFRDLEPKRTSINCEREEITKNQGSNSAAAVIFNFLTTATELRPLLITSLNSELNSSPEPFERRLLEILRCQAMYLYGKSKACVSSTMMTHLYMHDPLTDVVIAQTLKIMETQSTEYRAVIDDVVELNYGVTSPIVYGPFENSDYSTAFTALTFGAGLGSQGFDCFHDGELLHITPPQAHNDDVPCGVYGRDARRSVQNIQSSVGKVNSGVNRWKDIAYLVVLMGLLEDDRPEYRTPHLNILALYALQAKRFGTEDFVLEMMTRYGTGNVAVESYQSMMIKIFVYYHLGFMSEFSAQVQRLVNMEEFSDIPSQTKLGFFFDVLDACNQQMNTTCGMAAIDAALDVVDTLDRNGSKQMTNRLRANLVFENAKLLLWRNRPQEALRMLKQINFEEFSDDSARGLYETLAEGYIGVGDSKRARFHFEQAKASSRNVTRAGLSYAPAIHYLEGSCQLLIESLNSLNEHHERNFGISIFGLNIPFYIKGQLISPKEMKEDVCSN